jgi:cell shape-determining protein MreC
MKKINIIFYVALTLSFLIFLLPYQYKAAVYTPNVLGWIWFIILLPLTIVSFIVAGIINIKNRSWPELKLRSIIFVCAILLAIGYWYFWAYQYGNV